MTTTTVTQPTTWKIDPAHTQAEFEVRHMMFAKVRGRFTTVEGTVQFSPAGDIAVSRVDAVIASTSIDTGQAQRDEHLRSADFFDVARFPELRFVSRSAARAKDGSLTVTGDLSIRDVTRSVELSVTETGQGTDPWGQQRIGFTATTTLDRREFGLTWNQALETGGILVGNEVRITLEIQAIAAAAE